MRKLVLLIPLFVLMCLPTAVYANVMAGQLDPAPGDGGSWDFNTQGQMDIQYRLNEPATGITIEIFQTSAPGTVVKTITSATPAGTQPGLNTLQWDGSQDGGGAAPSGTYSFRVIAADSVGHAAWEKISDDGNVPNQFYSPRGVAVVTDETSEYFGRVIVAENGGPAASGRSTQSGFYVLNSDLSDAVGQGDNAITGGVGWTGGGASPFKLAFDDALNVFIADWSDGHSGVWRASQAALDASSAFDLILTENGRLASGLCENHGSVAAIWAEGSAGTTDLYTRDEDFWTRGEVLRYDIGAATNYSASPVVAATDFNYTVNYTMDMARDATGNWWLSQYRWTAGATTPHLWAVDSAGSALLYNNVTDGGLPGAARCYGGFGMSADSSTIATAGYNVVHMFDVASRNEITSFDFAGSANRDCAFDAAGNVYVTNSSSEILYVVSPGDGPNSYSTDYYGSFSTTSGLPVRDWVLY